MISFKRVEIKEIDETKIFDNVKDFLFDEEIELTDFDKEINFTNFNYETLSELPKEIQRLIFAKVGAMMIDYAGREDF